MIIGKVVAIDFDGTITKTNAFPEIGELRENVKEAINKIAQNNTVCIWTCRADAYAIAAFNFLNLKNINFSYFNKSPYDKINPNGRKIIADIYIDDNNIFMNHNVDWKQIEKYFMEND